MSGSLTMQAEEFVRQAAELHQVGRLQEAQVQYRHALELNPQHVGALHLSGILAIQSNLPQQALELLARAIQADPQNAELHVGHGYAASELMRHETAIESYDRAISLRPDYAEAYRHRGDALRELNRHEAAISSYDKALDIGPSAEIYNNRGISFFELKQFASAIASFDTAIALESGNATAHYNRGNSLRDLGQQQAAVESYERAIALNPKYLDAHLNLGSSLLHLGRYSAALSSFDSAIALNPGFAPAHSNRGSALHDLQRYGLAAASYRQAIKLKPDYQEAHTNLGNVLQELGRFDEAAASYQSALAIQPDNTEALTGLASAQRRQGLHAAAESTLRRASQLNSASPQIVLGLAEVTADQGQFAEAEGLYRRAFEMDNNLVAAWAGIAYLRKLGPGDTDWIEQSQRMALNPKRMSDQTALLFAMGKYFDDVKDHERAFATFQRANEMMKSWRLPHDRHLVSRTFDSTKQMYTRDYVEKISVWGDTSPRPVLVVGMPRSGTSLVEQILASHPAVFGAGELTFWWAASLRAAPTITNTKPGTHLFRQFAMEYLRLLAERAPESSRVVDKLPGNFRYLGMIHAALPNARIVHVRRDPLDTCLSIYFQHFGADHTYANDLADLAHYYTEYLNLMDHWRRVLPQEVMLEVSYEELVENPEVGSRRLVDFIGLPWSDACVNFHQTNRSVSTHSRWQVRQKINSTSMARWRNYAPFIAPLMRLSPPDSGA